MTNNVSPAALAIIKKMQQNELTESVIYKKIARFAKGEENKKTLMRLSNEEKAHYLVWKSYTGEDLKPQKAKAGVALIARQTKADILPASVYCEKKGGLFRKITVRYGELIKYEDLGITEEGGTRELREATDKVMGKIVDLWEEGHCK